MDLLQIAVEAAWAGAAVIRRYFATGASGSLKGAYDPVTIADRESEDAIVTVIRRARPDDGILAEEGSGTAAGGMRWIIDPLDGTVNFVHDIPHLAVSIAVYEGDDPLAAVVLDPFREEVFVAEPGEGTQLNGTGIEVSTTTDPSRAVVATGFPYDHDTYAHEYGTALAAVLQHVNGIRRFGAAALDLAWVAAARFDAYWELGVAPWDQAAGIVLVREAGGIVTDPFGAPSTPQTRLVVASNGHLHDRLLSMLAPTVPNRLVVPYSGSD